MCGNRGATAKPLRDPMQPALTGIPPTVERWTALVVIRACYMTWSALIVDDDPGIRQSIRLCLEVEGARVLGVGTAAAAIEAIDRSFFDVIFLDLWIGSDSGLTLLPEILRRQPGVGVIVITAYATIETAVEAMRSGAADYLPKPFSPDQVRLTAMRVHSARLPELPGDGRASGDRGLRGAAARPERYRQERPGALDQGS
jgi:DNA-binding NtrC family response regulator